MLAVAALAATTRQLVPPETTAIDQLGDLEGLGMYLFLDLVKSQW